MIEGKRHFDVALFHDNFASAVGKTPILVVEALKCLPGQRQISGSDLVYFRKTIMKEPAPSSSARLLSPRTLSSVSVSSIT